MDFHYFLWRQNLKVQFWICYRFYRLAHTGLQFVSVYTDQTFGKANGANGIFRVTIRLNLLNPISRNRSTTNNNLDFFTESKFIQLANYFLLLYHSGGQ